jgi:hypothetical protein
LRPSTSEEAAAAVEILKAFDSAVTAEYQKAGIKLADYRRYCGRNALPKTTWTSPASGAPPSAQFVWEQKLYSVVSVPPGVSSLL